MEQKPGIKTTEHWLAASVAATAGTVASTAADWRVQVAALAVLGAVGVAYLWARTKAKVEG